MVADLGNGGDVSSTRTALRFAGIYQVETGPAAGIAFSVGKQLYDFGSGAAKL
ncbi:hypothetical protein [Tateyamaria pelophila]|uniref:hypothetical protein n=1 Tax=Tateyamaria pelophila TaxID=328415 RepID=UPI001CBF6236|nr:hypothetical protein [Tateyamaria pelophila]